MSPPPPIGTSCKTFPEFKIQDLKCTSSRCAKNPPLILRRTSPTLINIDIVKDNLRPGTVCFSFNSSPLKTDLPVVAELAP